MEYFKRPIPKGYQIYSTFEVAGLHVGDRRARLDQFVSGQNIDVCLEPEPTNMHDMNAVLVVGLYDKKGLMQSLLGRGERGRVVLGYVPAREAEALQVTGALPFIVPRLSSASTANDSWASLTVDALGPRGTPLSKQYFDHVKRQQASAPASQRDLTFLRLCGAPVKKGLTTGDASMQVEELRAKLSEHEPSKLAELDALTGVVESLFDEFSDAENADMYELRKAPPAVVVAAAVNLSGRGMSAAQIEDDFDLVAEEIRKLRPSLSKS
ncbi:MAG: HIRAN domain-containing protein [Burkholderiales bacterium]|nr:HIRAN domain-containing protein [Burkholderiales bacterium]